MAEMADQAVLAGAKETFRLENRERYALLDRQEVLHSKRGYWALRRTQDVIFSALGLTVLLPFLLLVALVIYIDDPHGSPFFVQERIGRDGKPFKMLKFRSMVVNAEERLKDLMDRNEKDGPVFKIREDPRVTRVGRLIRKTSIDELPQLVNVLFGSMSLVGPRPALRREVEQYDDYERQRLLVQPGITCYWQVQPHRDDLSFEEWVDLDVKYIRERSFWVDWKILFATVRAVLGGHGS